MAFLENIFKGGIIAIGIGAAIVAPTVIRALRPIAKSLIKAGLIAYDQGRIALAATGDILAEARTELAEVGKATGEPTA